MSSFKGTPGPWRKGAPGPNGCYTIGTLNGLMTAMVAHSLNEPGQAEQAEADANLIASAPAMHAALTKIAFRCQCFIADDRYMQVESIQAILDICDSAIDTENQ